MSKIIEYKAKIRTIKNIITYMYMNLQEMISYVYTLYIEESLSLQSTVNVFFVWLNYVFYLAILEKTDLYQVIHC